MTLRSQSARESGPHQTTGTAGGIKPQLQCGIQHALISVIITTYNRTDALNAVLRALAAQTDRGFEVVVADDGSDQRTAQLVEAWSACFARQFATRALRHAKRGGYSGRAVGCAPFQAFNRSP